MENEIVNGRPFTFGEKAVGLHFNLFPQNQEVYRIQKGYAYLIDQMNNLRNETTSNEVKRIMQRCYYRSAGRENVGCGSNKLERLKCLPCREYSPQ